MPALFTRIGHMAELAGEEVIRIHRVLKNEVPIPEYILCSPEVTARLEDKMQRWAHPIEHKIEGFGTTPSYYFDLRELAELRSAPLRMSSPLRVAIYLWNNARGLPYRIGLKEPLSEFRNVPLE